MPEEFNLGSAKRELIAQGITIEFADEQFTTLKFLDVGVIAYYMKKIPWLVDG